jgi:rubredoxin
VSVTEETQDKSEKRLWICDTCGWVYDPEDGDPDGGLTPGTPFEEIPDDWQCPVCGARKRDFRAMEPGEDIPDDVN